MSNLSSVSDLEHMSTHIVGNASRASISRRRNLRRARTRRWGRYRPSFFHGEGSSLAEYEEDSDGSSDEETTSAFMQPLRESEDGWTRSLFSPEPGLRRHSRNESVVQGPLNRSQNESYRGNFVLNLPERARPTSLPRNVASFSGMPGPSRPLNVINVNSNASSSVSEPQANPECGQSGSEGLFKITKHESTRNGIFGPGASLKGPAELSDQEEKCDKVTNANLKEKHDVELVSKSPDSGASSDQERNNGEAKSSKDKSLINSWSKNYLKLMNSNKTTSSSSSTLDQSLDSLESFPSTSVTVTTSSLLNTTVFSTPKDARPVPSPPKDVTPNSNTTVCSTPKDVRYTSPTSTISGTPDSLNTVCATPNDRRPLPSPPPEVCSASTTCTNKAIPAGPPPPEPLPLHLLSDPRNCSLSAVFSTVGKRPVPSVTENSCIFTSESQDARHSGASGSLRSNASTSTDSLKLSMSTTYSGAPSSCTTPKDRRPLPSPPSTESSSSRSLDEKPPDLLPFLPLPRSDSTKVFSRSTTLGTRPVPFLPRTENSALSTTGSSIAAYSNVDSVSSASSTITNTTNLLLPTSDINTMTNYSTPKDRRSRPSPPSTESSTGSLDVRAYGTVDSSGFNAPVCSCDSNSSLAVTFSGASTRVENVAAVSSSTCLISASLATTTSNSNWMWLSNIRRSNPFRGQQNLQINMNIPRTSSVTNPGQSPPFPDPDRQFIEELRRIESQRHSIRSQGQELMLQQQQYESMRRRYEDQLQQFEQQFESYETLMRAFRTRRDQENSRPAFHRTYNIRLPFLRQSQLLRPGADRLFYRSMTDRTSQTLGVMSLPQSFDQGTDVMEPNSPDINSDIPSETYTEQDIEFSEAVENTPSPRNVLLFEDNHQPDSSARTSQGTLTESSVDATPVLPLVESITTPQPLSHDGRSNRNADPIETPHQVSLLSQSVQFSDQEINAHNDVNITSVNSTVSLSTTPNNSNLDSLVSTSVSNIFPVVSSNLSQLSQSATPSTLSESVTPNSLEMRPSGSCSNVPFNQKRSATEHKATSSSHSPTILYPLKKRAKFAQNLTSPSNQDFSIQVCKTPFHSHTSMSQSNNPLFSSPISELSTVDSLSSNTITTGNTSMTTHSVTNTSDRTSPEDFTRRIRDTSSIFRSTLNKGQVSRSPYNFKSKSRMGLYSTWLEQKNSTENQSGDNERATSQPPSCGNQTFLSFLANRRNAEQSQQRPETSNIDTRRERSDSGVDPLRRDDSLQPTSSVFGEYTRNLSRFPRANASTNANMDSFNDISSNRSSIRRSSTSTATSTNTNNTLVNPASDYSAIRASTQASSSNLLPEMTTTSSVIPPIGASTNSDSQQSEASASQIR